jgi:hypothetical protein
VSLPAQPNFLTLACRDVERMATVYRHLQQIDDVELLEEPFDSPHGFRDFSFRDPEGNI